MSVKFVTRTKRACGMVSIHIRIQNRDPFVSIRLKTPLRIYAEVLFDAPVGPKWLAFMQTEDGILFQHKCRLIQLSIEHALKEGKQMTIPDVRNLVDKIVFDKSIDNYYDISEVSALPRKVTFQDYRSNYLQQITNGDRSTYHGRNFAKGTIAAVSVALNRLHDFEESKSRQYDFEDIDLNFYRDFTAYLKSIPYSLNTIGKTIKVIKTVMHCAEDEGYHHNRNYCSQSFKTPKAETDAVYLTMEELDRINALDLSSKCPAMQLSRDIFMIGVWTAQRVSDYNNLKSSDIHYESIVEKGPDGAISEITIRTLHIVQQKTQKKLIIPCNSSLCKVLDKYPEKLPHVPDKQLNRHLKTICCLAGIDTLVEIRSTKGGVLSVATFKKYELIHSHTARRTGATLMYLSGMNVYDICRITGHSNVKTLERYIKATELETVRKISASYDYFK